MLPHHLLDLLAVQAFERAKTANIKRLEEVRGMGRHTKRNDKLFLAIFFEVDRVVALVAVEDKEPIYALRTSFC